MHKLNARPGQLLDAAGSARRIAALVGCSALMLATGASTEVAADPSFPDQLQPATDESLGMVVPARGVQIYECRATKNNGYAWSLGGKEDADSARDIRRSRSFGGRRQRLLAMTVCAWSATPVCGVVRPA